MVATGASSITLPFSPDPHSSSSPLMAPLPSLAALSPLLSGRQLHSAHRTPLNESASSRAVSPPTLDTSTLAAADYDVDLRTGFLPPQPPVTRLPEEFEAWESLLEDALGKLKLAQDDPTPDELQQSAGWRLRARQLPILSPAPLEKNELLLRRAHAVLAYLAQIYVHSQIVEEDTPMPVPAPLVVPLIVVSKELDIAPILTYSDTTIYNWGQLDPTQPFSPENLRSILNFSGTKDEEHFYLTSARIEFRGVEALEIMRASLNETYIGDTLAKKRLVGYLSQLASVIDDMTTILMRVREGCDPYIFYNRIRPWFRGGNSTRAGWIYEGVPADVSEWAGQLGGPSAGQSTLIHSLDAFLGVDHSNPADMHSKRADPGFVQRQRDYMPRHHRAFLVNLLSTPHSVRSLVESTVVNKGQEQRPAEMGFASGPTSGMGMGINAAPRMETETDRQLRRAYDDAVLALKKFRDGHIRIATLYIVNQAKHGKKRNVEEGLTGTGGTKLVPFLKEVRDNTTRTMMGPMPSKSG